MRFVTVDPGSTTGLCWADVEHGSHIPAHVSLHQGLLAGTVKTEERDMRGRVALAIVCSDLAEEIFLWEAEAVVIEDFALRGPHLKGAKALDPVRVAWALCGALATLDFSHVTWQTAADKEVASNVRLKDWGLWRVGSEHERDAMKHAVLFLRNIGKGRK